MAGRLYGELDEALNWACGFSEHETDPPCMVPAQWHGIILDDDQSVIVAVIASCDDHREVMALSATYVHEMDSACGLPGSIFVWPENECLMPEQDDAVLFGQATMAALS
jgi:hypothetical protein